MVSVHQCLWLQHDHSPGNRSPVLNQGTIRGTDDHLQFIDLATGWLTWWTVTLQPSRGPEMLNGIPGPRRHKTHHTQVRVSQNRGKWKGIAVSFQANRSMSAVSRRIFRMATGKSSTLCPEPSCRRHSVLYSSRRAPSRFSDLLGPYGADWHLRPWGISSAFRSPPY